MSAAGDVNGDGVDDLLIGAYSANPNGNSSGASYVVFDAVAPNPIDIDGNGDVDAFTDGLLILRYLFGIRDPALIEGSMANDCSRCTVLEIETFLQGLVAPASEAVVELASLDGSNGFVLNGVSGGDRSGRSVSAAGDVNGDGVDDLLIGAYRADPNGNDSGASYVVFGASGVGSSGTLELSSLDGNSGFVLNGVTRSEGLFVGDRSGRSVSAAGDVNGDGVDDLLIGAYRADPNGSTSGASYVVFGASGVGGSGTLELSSLDGSNGFVLNGVTAFDFSGGSVSAAGDVNGDGVDDLLIGAFLAGPNGNFSGASYVVFGASGVGSGGTLELSSLDGSNGFVLNGAAAGDNSGRSVSAAGDVNGDGVDDLLIGANGADPNGNYSGASYLVFGASGVGSSGTLELSSLDGSNGFVLNGVTGSDNSGFSVSAAGDVNGDGVDDLLIGAHRADPNGNRSGASYVVFGASGVGSSGTLELSSLDGSNGFVLNGVTADDQSGVSVSAAGDVNSDGVDDLLIGAGVADSNGNRSGASYVVFGASGVGSSGTLELSSLDGSSGFVLNGVTGGDRSGVSVSAAGDLNGDGVDDLLIGAAGADPNGSASGASYVVFGAVVPSPIDIDGNGDVDALTDGLLILRYLFGIRGPALIEGAVANDCSRCTVFEIEEFLQGLVP